MNLLKDVFTSVNFWSSVIASIIGGIIAFLIARYQVKKSEKEAETKRNEDNIRYQEQQEQLMEKERQDIEESQKRIITFVEESAKRNREMELIKMQIKECDESITSLTNIPLILSKMRVALENYFKDYVLGNDIRENQNLFSELAGELLRVSNLLITSSKIVGLNEKEINDSQLIRDKMFLFLESGENNSVNLEVFNRESKAISLKCGEMINYFIERRETLIAEFKNNLP